MTRPLLITAHLASPLAGDPPQLDALMEWSLSPFAEDFRNKQRQGVPHPRVDRGLPAPTQGNIRIPIEREWLGKFLVALASSPIVGNARVDSTDHICKRIAVEASGLLHEDERKVIAITNSWTKSYRLPLRIRTIDRVAWFASGTRQAVRKVLRDVQAIGKKVSDGYGRVREWIVEEVVVDQSWFADTDAGRVLMRPMPVGPWLPADILGGKRHFGACCPPYWHPERFGEIVVPC